jgi:ubiquitin carboxyl-terminal hydrolase 5/13
VVKSGTITAEGSASVHCYTCDEEVNDNELALHLGVLGVNIADQRKTEKTIQ